MDHIFEIKLDGVRCLAVVENNTVRMQSRHLLEMTARFPELADLRELPDGTVHRCATAVSRICARFSSACISRTAIRELLCQRHIPHSVMMFGFCSNRQSNPFFTQTVGWL